MTKLFVANRACGLRLLLLLFSFSVCSVQHSLGDEPAPPKGAAPAAGDVAAVLKKLLATYRDAKTYSDKGLLTIAIATPDGPQLAEFDAQLTFERPNRVRMEFQPPIPPEGELVQRLIVSNGKRLAVRSDDHPAQVLVIDAPEKDVATAMFASKTVGPLLTDELVGGNLLLKLLAADALPATLDIKQAKLLEPADWKGEKLDRIEIPTQHGNLALWFEPKTSLIKRIVYPPGKVLELLKPLGATEVEIATQVNEAKLNEPLPADAFAWKKEEGENYVKEFIPSAGTDPAAELLGQPVPEFPFTTAAGEKQTPKALAGKVVVLDFWATWCGWCLKGMPHVDRVRQKYAKNDKVQFLALSEDSADAKDQQLIDVLKQIKVEMPWGRVAADGADELNAKLGFAGIPGMIVLGPDGRVQYHHVGFDPKLEEHLPPVLDALLAGEDLAAKAKETQAAKLQEFKQRLDAVRTEGP